MARIDQTGEFRTALEKNKKKILLTQNVCGICGQPVDKSYKFPHPLSPTIDHIIPIAQGGHPSDLDNLQLAHFSCNRAKSDKLPTAQNKGATATNKDAPINNRVLPQTINWLNYKAL